MIDHEKYLLTCLAEEASEVAVRASKAIRFGLHEIQPGQEKTNTQRLIDELTDLIAVIQMLGLERHIDLDARDAAIRAKWEKIDKFYQYSRQLGEAQ